MFLGIVRFAIWNHFGGHFGQKLVCLGYAVWISNRYLMGNIPDINKKPKLIPHREEVRISYVWWRLRDSNPSKCKKPVASCGHQFKNWWQPYVLLGAKRPSSPVVLPVHEKSGLFHIVGSAFWVLTFSNKNVFNSIIILLTGRICYAIIMKSSQSRPFGR